MNNQSSGLDKVSTRTVAFFLVTVWMIYLLILLFLQLVHLPFGFKVWPLGEDRNWIMFMHDGPGLRMVHLFWQTDFRNPLSAWWWAAVSPLVKASDWGLYLVRKCVDPLLSIITFLLLDRIGRQQCRTFAFSVALVVLFWNFSGYYYDQILWDFLVALGFSLLTIYFYCGYIDNQRKSGQDLALSLICYLVAIATYTLQSGALVAVLFLALFRQSDPGKQNILRRIFPALTDTGFFVAIFVIYNCIWYTVSSYVDSLFAFNWHLFSHQLFASLQQFIYHSTYTDLFQLMRSDWSVGVISLILIVSFIFALLILIMARKQNLITRETGLPLAWVMVILASIALPTIAVEATSSIWYPGSRSLMMQQVWQPILYVTIIFFLANILFKKYQQAQKTVLVAVAFLTALALLAGLNYNYRLVLRTHYQRTLVKGLEKFAIPFSIQPYFLVKLMNPENKDIDSITPLIKGYSQIKMNQKIISLRVFQQAPAPVQAPYWVIRFNNDNEGVNNAAPLGDNSPIPYSRVWIVFYDGKKVWVPKMINKEDLAGLQVDWQRGKQIDQMNKQE